MTPLNARNLHNLFLIFLGPVLLLSIILSVWHTINTYKETEYKEQESLWGVLQLDKEIRQTQFRAKEYIHDLTSLASLKMSYEILWSRVPVTINSLQQDKSLSLSETNNINPLITGLFNHIKAIEPVIMVDDQVDKEALGLWAEKLKTFEDTINITLVHNIASVNSRYAKNSTNILIKAATIPSFFIICFILYLGYLLLTLWNEHKLNQHLLDHDSLTGLHSRDYIMNHLDELCKTDQPFVVLAFDLNKFKIINDTLGHHAGDQLLKHFAKLLCATLVKEGTAGRVGGDEFLWVSTTHDQSLVNHYYGSFLLALKQPCRIEGQDIYVSVSAGAAMSSTCNNHLTCVLEQADSAMYQAKQKQLKTIFWYQAEASTKVKEPKPKTVPLPV